MPKIPHRPILAAFLSTLAAAEVFASGGNNFGIPVYLDQATYTINDYDDPTTDLSRSHLDGDRFSSQLMTQLNAKYPSIRVQRSIALRDADVTWSNYRASNQNVNEMVMFCGHGGPSGMYMKNNLFMYPSDKSYGGWTRWLFSSSCELLRNHDANFYAPMFAGMHGIFGYESISYEYIWHSCNLFGCSTYHRSEDVWNEFANNWVNSDLFMYDAWVQAVSSTIYKYGGGVAPGAVYLYGTVNGQGFIGGCEKPWNVFNGDVSWSGLNKIHRYEVYGTPQY